MYVTSANPVSKPTGAGTPADALGATKRMCQSESDSQESYECPTCGKPLSTEVGMKTHHSMVHGESIAGEECECVACGGTFSVPPSTAEGRKYCSEDCMAEGYESRVQATCEVCGEGYSVMQSRADSRFCSRECTTAQLSKERRDRVVVECTTCGDEIEKHPCEAEGYENHFCDHGCYGEWVAANMTGENHPAWEGGKPEAICATCGSKTTQHYGNAEVGENAFCDRECYMDWHAENMVGEDHPRWKGGEARYGEGWNPKKKEAVRERDGRECQHCGRTEAEHIEEHGAKHTVHHIVPARQFDAPEERNAMENLITLCRGECHWAWEKMAPLRPVSD